MNFQPQNIVAGILSSTIAAGSAVSLTTATSANVTSLSLAAGQYLIWGTVDYTLTGATQTDCRAGLSLTSATLPTQAGGSGLGPDALCVEPFATTTVTDTNTLAIGPTTLSLTTTTTLYLVAQSTFSAGTEAAYGTLFAMPLRAP
jgi:hypothetical protein